MSTYQNRRGWGVGSALLLTVGVLVWWSWRLPLAEPPQAPRPAPSLAAPPEAVVHADTAPVNLSPDAVLIRPAGSAEVDARGMLPHPLTPTHERIFRENNLIGNLNGAMDVEDVAGLRALLKQYRNEFPEDAHVLADGYELVANCLEHPGAETRAAAQRYYDEQLDSGLRRYIRRHCLEGSSNSF
jgi:hypothetical protein